jgi:DNA-directed RNA polymerase specialized sigma24 family protein
VPPGGRGAARGRCAPAINDATAFSEETSSIERDATHAAVVAALRAHVQANDERTVTIITKWLDAADELGRAPSTREVAELTGVSHTTVAQALHRFREALAREL